MDVSPPPQAGEKHPIKIYDSRLPVISNYPIYYPVLNIVNKYNENILLLQIIK